MRLIVFLFVVLFASNTYHLLDKPPTPRDGEVLAVYDEDYFSVAKRIIDDSDESILLIAFEIKYYNRYQDSKANQLVESLIQAHKRGVDVRVVTDEYPNKYGDGANEVVRLLRSHGIDARLDGPERTTHAKVLVVDGTYVLVGSTNWSFTSLEKNREVNLLVRSRNLARDVEQYFNSL